jgi:hypothetical protein
MGLMVTPHRPPHFGEGNPQVTTVPLFMRLREHHCINPQFPVLTGGKHNDFDDGLENAWLPPLRIQESDVCDSLRLSLSCDCILTPFCVYREKSRRRTTAVMYPCTTPTSLASPTRTTRKLAPPAFMSDKTQKMICADAAPRSLIPSFPPSLWRTPRSRMCSPAAAWGQTIAGTRTWTARAIVAMILTLRKSSISRAVVSRICSSLARYVHFITHTWFC